MPPIGAGSRVAHAVFGDGTVQEVAGSGESTRLRIRFDRSGIKTIRLKYAQLSILPG